MHVHGQQPWIPMPKMALQWTGMVMTLATLSALPNI